MPGSETHILFQHVRNKMPRATKANLRLRRCLCQWNIFCYSVEDVQEAFSIGDKQLIVIVENEVESFSDQEQSPK